MAYGFSRQTYLAVGVLTVGLSLLTALRAEGSGVAPDFPRSQVSDRGLYAVTVRPEVIPPPVGTLHRWTVTVTDAAGRPADGLTITVSGGMPAHRHGLPTQPVMTGSTGNGEYRLDGLKFNMPGKWVVRLSLDGAGGADTVIVPFDL